VLFGPGGHFLHKEAAMRFKSLCLVPRQIFLRSPILVWR
jgi:hypothetical protein